MAEVLQEAKQESSTPKTFDQLADEFEAAQAAKAGSPKDGVTSDTVDEQGVDSKEADGQAAGADQPKNAKGESEADTDETQKDEDSEIPQPFHKNPKWQKLLNERNEARAALEELKSAQKDVEEFKKFVSSPQYVEQKMRAEGYTQEAITAKLKELGHEPVRPFNNHLEYIAHKKGFDPRSVDPNTAAAMEDVATISELMFDKRLAEFVKSEIEPLKQLFAEQVQQKEGSKLISEIQAKVKADGIFDFQKEVLPVLNDFLEKNPDATQPQVKEFFRETYHSESIKRLKAAGKKEEREGKKENLRQNLPAGSGVKPGAMPAKTGDFEKDADNWFAHRGI